jgi:hypothetical protein
VILKNLKGAKAVIQIISENYKQSEICLNEMGAAWVFSTNVIPFIVPNVRFDTVGFIHGTTQLLQLNNEGDLFKFQDDHGELRGTGKSRRPTITNRSKIFLK